MSQLGGRARHADRKMMVGASCRFLHSSATHAQHSCVLLYSLILTALYCKPYELEYVNIWKDYKDNHLYYLFIYGYGCFQFFIRPTAFGDLQVRLMIFPFLRLSAMIWGIKRKTNILSNVEKDNNTVNSKQIVIFVFTLDIWYDEQFVTVLWKKWKIISSFMFHHLFKCFFERSGKENVQDKPGRHIFIGAN